MDQVYIFLTVYTLSSDSLFFLSHQYIGLLSGDGLFLQGMETSKALLMTRVVPQRSFSLSKSTSVHLRSSAQLRIPLLVFQVRPSFCLLFLAVLAGCFFISYSMDWWSLRVTSSNILQLDTLLPRLMLSLDR